MSVAVVVVVVVVTVVVIVFAVVLAVAAVGVAVVVVVVSANVVVNVVNAMDAVAISFVLDNVMMLNTNTYMVGDGAIALYVMITNTG